MKKIVLLLAGILTLSLSACGSAANSAAEAAFTPQAEKSAARAAGAGFNYAADEAVEESYAEDADYSADGEAGPVQEASVLNEDDAAKTGKSSRKLITTANISTETDDVEAFADSIEKKIEALGGYVESENIYSNSDYYREGSKAADITARVPADRFQEFMSDVEGNSNVTSRSVNTQDVTLDYTDTEAHERALASEQAALENMMAHAETMEDIIAIQSQLTDVRYRLDSIRSQLRTYDNDITYSKIFLNITETKKFTVTKEETAWDRIRNGFVDNLLSVMDAVTEFIIWFLTHIPSLIMICIILLVLILIIRRISGSGKKKKAMKQNAAARPVVKAGNAPAVETAAKPAADDAAKPGSEVSGNTDNIEKKEDK